MRSFEIEYESASSASLMDFPDRCQIAGARVHRMMRVKGTVFLASPTRPYPAIWAV